MVRWLVAVLLLLFCEGKFVWRRHWKRCSPWPINKCPEYVDVACGRSRNGTTVEYPNDCEACRGHLMMFVKEGHCQ